VAGFAGAYWERRLNVTTNVATVTNYLSFGGETVALVTETSASPGVITTLWQLKDHLGSTTTLLDASGLLSGTRKSYDVWGKRRHVTGEDDTTNSIVSASSRDFTGHEFLEELRLVHMGGRIYDPVVARFLSPDPFVQDPFNLQNLNRYSYVLNNPLAYTDPDGFFFKSVFRAVFGGVYAFLPREVRQVVKPVLIGIATFTAGPQAGIFVATYTGAIDGALSGGLKGAIFGAVTSGASAVLAYGIGQIDLGILPVGAAADSWQIAADIAVKSAIHGVAQGALATAQGGEFGPAFLAASFSHAVGGGMQATDILNGEGFGLLAARTLSAAVAGGTAAVIGGGKFANGAMTAAFVHLFNAEQWWRHAMRMGALGATNMNAEMNRHGFTEISKEVLFRSDAGVTVRIDGVYSSGGQLLFGEAKTGNSADLTSNQLRVFKDLQEGRGVFYGSASGAVARSLGLPSSDGTPFRIPADRIVGVYIFTYQRQTPLTGRMAGHNDVAISRGAPGRGGKGGPY
jgi:RHS repeat-associated protein